MKTPTPMGVPGGKCPIPGCTRGKDDHHAMCMHHWHLVPRPMKNRLWEAASGMKQSLYSLPKVEKYRAVLNTCVTYVKSLKEAADPTAR